MLRQVWADPFIAGQNGQWRWRVAGEIGTGQIVSPYDPAARYRTKRSVEWVGDKVHLAETCAAPAPHLPHVITEVETTPATTPDDVLLGTVQESLAARDLLPAEQLADRAYVQAGALVASRAREVDLVGPVAVSPGWPARQETGFDKSQIVVDWEQQRIVCPAGKQSVIWRALAQPTRTEVWEVRFSPQDGGPCPHRPPCTRSKTQQREIRLLPQAQHAALEPRREEQKSSAFQQRCQARAGLEATHEQAIRRAGLRRSRYVGQAKTHLPQVLTALAINFLRIADWWEGKTPAPTRHSRFARLQPAPAS